MVCKLKNVVQRIALVAMAATVLALGFAVESASAAPKGEPQKSASVTMKCGNTVFTATVTGGGIVQGDNWMSNGQDGVVIECSANGGNGRCTATNDGNDSNGVATCDAKVQVSDIDAVITLTPSTTLTPLDTTLTTSTDIVPLSLR